MRLPKFTYLSPKSVGEARAMLGEHKGEARLLAGGTDIIVAMKQRRKVPEYLVNLKDLSELSYVRYSDADGLALGALVTLDDIQGSAVVREKFPALSQAAAKVAAPQIRNSGTIGGNLCLDSRCWYYNQSEFWRSARAACFKMGGDQCYVVKGGKQCYSLVSADTAPALIALGASAKVVGPASERTVAVEKFFTGEGRTLNVLDADEIVTEIAVPNQPAGSGEVYLKFSYREAIDFPLVGVAAMVSLNGNGKCQDVRIAVGAASPAPIRTVKAEEALRGKEIDEDVLAEAAQAATKEVSPIVHIYAPVAYKRKLVGVLVQRAVRQALQAARSA
ncbi:MAG: FAD binding domain-containing protein [Chloroflexi bacterium]|nr:FAD binding domain-containing protein [Chloroflexota bacterium]